MQALELSSPARFGNLQDLPTGCMMRLCCCMENMLVNVVVKGRVAPPRLRNEKTPKDYGMPNYKDVSFNASDGVRLSAWEIIKPEHTKLVLINHPLACTRYGSLKGFDGVPVEFLPMVKRLCEGGFNVLMYDNRCQGESDGGIQKFGTRVGDKDVPCGVGSEEWRDVLGAVSYIEQHPVLSTNKLVFLGQCMGSNAMLGAWERHPEKLQTVAAFMVVMPVISYNMGARVTHIKIKKNLVDQVEQSQSAQFGVKMSNPLNGMAKVACPVMILQMKEEMYTYNPQAKMNDAQLIFDACKTPKEIVYIGKNTEIPFGTTGKRFEAYGYLNVHPDRMIAFFNQYAV